MCGICGITYNDSAREVDPGIIEGMCQAMVHRGPDEEGLYVKGRVGLGSRRLSIIDIAQGQQPMQNKGGDLRVVFNGEIYNHTELRRRLESVGHNFRTSSDTEVLLHAYQQWGEDFALHLNGMFAIALWDNKEQKLILARDRIGQKPLYFADFDGAIIFASELPCLLKYPRMPRNVDLPAIYHYLTLQYIPRGHSGLKGIQQLDPAHILVWKKGQYSIHRYWDLCYLPKHTGTIAEMQEELRARMGMAVKRRMMSEVPLGAHLSGGIDSSIIVALMARSTSAPIETFSIGFEEEDFNELHHARRVARTYGTTHHEFVIKPDAISILPKMVRHFGEPLADPAAIPTWYLCQRTREHVTVALNGDGGDEFFGGYSRYWGDALADAYSTVPGPLRRGLDRALHVLPVRSNKRVENNFVQALRQLSQAATLPRSASIIRWGTYFNENMKRDLFLDADDSYPPTHSLLMDDFGFALSNSMAEGYLDLTLYVDTHNYLPGALLSKMDRMAMAHSLEPRSPFLDVELMEYVARLPVSQKLSARKTKKILHDVFDPLLPSSITKRPKAGFSVPLGTWFKGPLHDYARYKLLSPNSEVGLLLDLRAIEGLIEDNKNSRSDNGKRLWALLVLEEWMEQINGG